MLQVRVHGPGDARVDDVPEPDPGPRDAVVRVAPAASAAATCPTSAWAGSPGPATPRCASATRSPGRVDWVGADVTRVRVGDRVVVQPGNDELGRIGNGAPEGGLTPLLLVTEADRGRLHRVPDDLPLDVAAFAEPLAVGMHAAEQADVRPGDGSASSVAARSAWPRSPRSSTGATNGSSPSTSAPPASSWPWLSERRLRLTRPPPTSGPSSHACTGPRPSCSGRRRPPPPSSRPPGPPRSSPMSSTMAPSAPGSRWSPSTTTRCPTSYLMVLMKEFTIRGSMEYPARFDDAIDLLARRDLRRSSPTASRSSGSAMPWPSQRVQGLRQGPRHHGHHVRSGR